MTQSRARKLRILVVEDDANIRRTYNELLNMYEYDVTTVPDAEKALTILENFRFDLLITDLGLPGMTGWDLSRAVKQLQQDIPILAVTSWQGKEAEKRLSVTGIDAVLYKPFRFDQVEAIIRRLCPIEV